MERSGGERGSPPPGREVERERKMVRDKNLSPVHPGEILLEELMKPLGLSQYRLAKDISVSARRINEIVHGKRGISAETAMRLGRYFGLPAEFWMNLQAHYELRVAKDRLQEQIEKEVTPRDDVAA